MYGHRVAIGCRDCEPCRDRERTAAEQQQQLVGVVVGRTVAAAQAARA